MSVPTLPAPDASRNPQPPTAPASTSPSHRGVRHRPRTGDLAVDTTTGALLDLERTPGAAAVLPHGKADGRYRCPACQHPIELAAATGPAPEYTARFRHAHSDRCQASADQNARIRTALNTNLELAAHLRAHQGALTTQVTAATAEPEHTSPLALAINHPATAATIHLADTLTDHQLAQLLHHHPRTGPSWVIFNRHSPAYFQPAGTITVRCHRQNLTHTTLTPTRLQRQLAAAGYAVAWREGDILLLPYGGRPFTYTPRPGEHWDGSAAVWKQDWKISQPRPARGATWWGLIPVPLHTLATPALLGAAARLMVGIQAFEKGREDYRRGQARTRAAHHAQPAPATELLAYADTAVPDVPSKSAALAPVPPQPPSPRIPVPPPNSRIAWRSWLTRLGLRPTTGRGTAKIRRPSGITAALRARIARATRQAVTGSSQH